MHLRDAFWNGFFCSSLSSLLFVLRWFLMIQKKTIEKRHKSIEKLIINGSEADQYPKQFCTARSHRRKLKAESNSKWNGKKLNTLSLNYNFSYGARKIIIIICGILVCVGRKSWLCAALYYRFNPNEFPVWSRKRKSEKEKQIEWMSKRISESAWLVLFLLHFADSIDFIDAIIERKKNTMRMCLSTGNKKIEPEKNLSFFLSLI